jgi:hypothetical protein
MSALNRFQFRFGARFGKAGYQPVIPAFLRRASRPWSSTILRDNIALQVGPPCFHAAQAVPFLGPAPRAMISRCNGG